MYAALLLCIVMGLLLALMTWGVWRLKTLHDNVAARAGDELLWAMLALATLSLGVFVTFVLLGFRH